MVPPDIAAIETLEKIDLSANPIIPAIHENAKKGHDHLVKWMRSEEYDNIYFQWKKDHQDGEGEKVGAELD